MSLLGDYGGFAAALELKLLALSFYLLSNIVTISDNDVITSGQCCSNVRTKLSLEIPVQCAL